MDEESGADCFYGLGLCKKWIDDIPVAGGRPQELSRQLWGYRLRMSSGCVFLGQWAGCNFLPSSIMQHNLYELVLTNGQAALVQSKLHFSHDQLIDFVPTDNTLLFQFQQP